MFEPFDETVKHLFPGVDTDHPQWNRICSRFRSGERFSGPTSMPPGVWLENVISILDKIDEPVATRSVLQGMENPTYASIAPTSVSTQNWEFVAPGCNRIPVPGGWLYQTTGDGIAFVPKEKIPTAW